MLSGLHQNSFREVLWLSKVTVFEVDYSRVSQNCGSGPDCRWVGQEAETNRLIAQKETAWSPLESETEPSHV